MPSVQSSAAHKAGSEQEVWIVQRQPHRKLFCNGSTPFGRADALSREKFIHRPVTPVPRIFIDLFTEIQKINASLSTSEQTAISGMQQLHCYSAVIGCFINKSCIIVWKPGLTSAAWQHNQIFFHLLRQQQSAAKSHEPVEFSYATSLAVRKQVMNPKKKKKKLS